MINYKLLREELISFFKSPLFLVGLAIKVVLLFLFPTHFPRELFIPFFDTAVQHITENPWSLSPTHYFPYGGFLYIVLLIPKYILYLIFGESALGSGPIGLFALKAPLLVFDILFLFVLSKIAQERKKALLTLYWLNPALIFISYIHGQLDVVSMCLVTFSVYALLRDRVLMSSLFFAFALLSKFHIAAVAPLVLVYIWNNRFRKQALSQIFIWSSVVFVISGFGFLPVLIANNINYVTVGSPEALRLLGAQIAFSNEHIVYLGVVITLLALGRLVISTKISELGLVLAIGAVFSTLVAASYAGPGWYYWSLPYFALFFALYLNIPRVLFWFLVSLYVLFYAILPEFSDVIKNFQLVSNVFYTIMQTALVANLLALWVIAMRQEAPAARRARPIRIGLSGDSGSGKNLLTSALMDIYGASNVATIEGDNYHKWERGHDQWEKYTHLNPKANHLFALSQHVSQISQGRPVFHSTYSHSTGKFTAPVELKPSKVVVVQGLHSFFLRNMRDLFDLKIFLSPDPLVRTAWKINRDCLQRGYSKEKVLAQLQKRADDSAAYIASQKQAADLIIEHIAVDDFTEAKALAGELPKTSVCYTTWNNYDLSNLTRELQKVGLKVEFELIPNNVEQVFIKISGEISSLLVTDIAHKLFPKIRQMTRGRNEPVWREGSEGITQLIVLSLLSQKLGDE